MSRADGFANYSAATAAPADFAMPSDVRNYLDAHSTAHYNPADHNVAGDEMPVTGADNGLKLADMMGKSYDDPQWEELLDQLTVDEMAQLVQIGGFSTVAMRSVNKKATMDSNGTGGLNDWYAGVYGTPYPTETLIGPVYNGANSDLLNDVLRGEWGFEGMVLTDWYGSYGYQLTMDSVLNGNDIMLGFGSNVRTAIENTDSPTMGW